MVIKSRQIIVAKTCLTQLVFNCRTPVLKSERREAIKKQNTQKSGDYHMQIECEARKVGDSLAFQSPGRFRSFTSL